jgi:outer membrane lipoprotein-sorting protein
MNCLECQDNLVACVEHALDPQTAADCQRHLADCPACRQQYDAIARLQRQLVTHGETAATVSLAGPVMSRIRSAQRAALPGRRPAAVLTRWLLGLGTAAAACAVAAILVLMPNSRAQAADVMTQGAKVAAQLTSVHLQGRMRAPAAENFSYINPAQEFTNIELWKELGGQGRWRVEKPGRIAAMDGQSTTLFLRPSNTAMRLPQPTRSAFDTEWLHRIANLEQTLSSETSLAQTKGWPMTLTHETVGGATKSVVTIEQKSGLPAGDYLQNKFLGTADTRRVYRFDEQSGQLEAAQIYVHDQTGVVLVFELTQIEYNPPLVASIFQIELPADVAWYQKPQAQPDDAKYAALTAEQAATAFFEACARQDWTEVAKFMGRPVDVGFKSSFGGLKLISVGQAFTSAAGGSGSFVPYEIQLRTKDAGFVTKKFNLALQKDPKTGRWFFAGGL